jgi:ferrous iron transport protein A
MQPRTQATKRPSGGQIVRLEEVRTGDEGVLLINGAADSTVQRLMSMGLIPGAHVKVVRVAPLGDPIMLEITGYRVCVRRREAMGLCIKIQSTAETESAARL